MLLEFTGICQHCAEEVSVVVLDGQVIDKCHACSEIPFAVNKVKGLIYVVSNPNQTGVKIGLTTKSLDQRIKSLNTTGVAGSFVPIAIFPSNRPKLDEQKVHDKLTKFRIAKEHFDLEPVDAVLKAYRALNKRKPIFYDPYHEETFGLRLEQAKVQMKLRLRGKRE